jgi:16S rRNA (cytosine1402-N4)-methyltransferase
MSSGMGDDDRPPHRPVLVERVVDLLGGRGLVVDMTLGAGGHAGALLAAGAGRVLGVDRDPQAARLASERLAGFGDRFTAVVGRFSETPDLEPASVDGVLYDLGLSSMQLDRADRGFGYRAEGPLDMRMGTGGPTAADLVNSLPEEELARIIFEYGEERRSRRIARAIVRARERARIETTDQLARVVAGAAGRRPGGAHPARRTFQALRIAVNRELEELASSLPRAAGLLAPGGRIVVIAYHSLEDRIVKRFVTQHPSLHALTPKPFRPDPAEVAANPRARSARLRAGERVEDAA